MWDELSEGSCIMVAAVEWPCCVDPWADRRSCPWLEIHQRWKAVIKPAAKFLHEVLCDFALPRDCMLCGGDLSKGEGNHLLEAEHWKTLREKLPEGRHVVAASMNFWQQWKLPEGTLRFNHVHGQVELSRGAAPSPSMRRESTGLSGQDRPQLLLRREVVPGRKGYRAKQPKPSVLQDSSAAARRSSTLTCITGLPAPRCLETSEVFREQMRHGQGRRQQVDWQIYPYLEPDTEPDPLAIQHFAWRLWLEFVAKPETLATIHRAFRPNRCFVCNTTVPMSQSFVQHLRTSAHFTALCSSVRGQSTLTAHPTQSFETPWGEILELDHLQLLLRQRRGHGVDDVEPLMLGVTEIEELAWRFWRQYVATAEATEEVQELLIQHEVFKESLVCAVCREALTSHGVGEHLRSPRHFRKLLWWLLQGDLLWREDLFRRGRHLRQSFQSFRWCLKLDHLHIFLTRVMNKTGSSKADEAVFEISKTRV